MYPFTSCCCNTAGLFRPRDFWERSIPLSCSRELGPMGARSGFERHGWAEGGAIDRHDLRFSEDPFFGICPPPCAKQGRKVRGCDYRLPGAGSKLDRLTAVEGIAARPDSQA